MAAHSFAGTRGFAHLDRFDQITIHEVTQRHTKKSLSFVKRLDCAFDCPSTALRGRLSSLLRHTPKSSSVIYILDWA
jgi:hypothetical protein